MNKRKVVMIPTLQGFVLKIENEINLYDYSMKYLVDKASEIRNKYRISLEIQKFLDSFYDYKDKELAIQNYDDFLNKNVKDNLKYSDIFEIDFDKSFNGEGIYYNLKPNKGIKLDECFPGIGGEKLFQIVDAINSLGDKVIVEIVRIFESFFSKVLKRLILENPEMYLHGRTISYDKLIKSDLEDLKVELINEEVTNLMYDTLDTLCKIDKNHGLGLSNYKSLWDSFIEINLHRNIIVHNDGVVNDLYLSKLPKSCKKNMKVGERIYCTKESIKRNVYDLLKFSYLIYYLVGKNEEDYDMLEKIAFDFLKKSNWELAQFCYELLMKIKRNNQEKLFSRINYLNAKKHILGLDSVKQEILDLDVTGMTDLYSIAKNLLLENNRNVTIELERSYPDTYNSMTIATWPIFIEYRKTEEYKKFREKHKDDFEPFEYKPEIN